MERYICLFLDTTFFYPGQGTRPKTETLMNISGEISLKPDINLKLIPFSDRHSTELSRLNHVIRIIALYQKTREKTVCVTFCEPSVVYV